MRTFFSSALLLFSFALAAQQMPLSQEEIWNNSVTITLPAYRVAQWTGDAVLFTGDAPNSQGSLILSVSTKSGKMETLPKLPATTPPAQPQMPKVNGVNPAFSPDFTYVAYTRNNDLYTLRLSDHTETRLTFDGSDVVLNGYASWVYMEEILGRASAYRSFWWSPDSKHLAFFRSDDSEVPLFTITDAPHQQAGYAETMRYPKSGNPLPKVQAGMVAPDGGDIVWAQVEAPDPFYLALPYWRPDGKALWIQWSNREQNHLQILEANITSGATRLIYEERQDTWINIDREPRIKFLESGKGFILSSDKSGWQQLYLYDMDGNLLSSITNGEYTVLNVLRIDEKEKYVYFTCYKDNIGCEDFYKASFDGKKLQRLTFGHYTHRINMSPDGKFFVTTYSNVGSPPQVALCNNQGKVICTVQDTKTPDFDRYQRPQVEFTTIKSADGKFDLPLRIIYPLNMNPDKKYPVALSVYGGPGSMSARDGWMMNAFGGLVHQYAQDGLMQVTIDHRGSGHNGKVGQNEMYRNLGYWEIRDYTQCVEWLVANKQADPAKIFISGFSYGGYITSYALTCGAETFTHGIAGGSVTDWLLYDATYTERYMNTPAENPEGYTKSAVLTYADKLKGTLLLTHGLRDDNVHAQNTFELVGLLEEYNKTFELMLYPENRHGYRGNKSIHSRNNDIRFIYKYLIEKPVPVQALLRPN
ncbi:MAG: DPP IV N-terminal domain-containing protein [Bacteroidetes bacterium]|nr:DPP IV N-terminal domain-containing protein [Bacteroidota bacterium]